jgi:glycosyltransferase involved in cell wall biosynthesis
MLYVALYLRAWRPDLVIISQGDNYDGLHFGHLCRKLKWPYVLICQKATDHFWPKDESRKYMRAVFDSAVACLFVSNHNRKLTEDQVGCQFANASVVRNPFLVAYDQSLQWPSNEENFRLACVGRLAVLDKGQDILLRVLAREKWKGRNLSVSFFGHGVNREGLIGLAGRLGVRNVAFPGFTDDVAGIWKDHHALIMPSRCEGLPLALVEAMLCSRTAIVTNVGGNSEIIHDDETGFVASAAGEDEIDEALERAWKKRHEWQSMGELAGIRIRALVPPNPAAEFADHLMQIVSTLDLERTRAKRALKDYLNVPHKEDQSGPKKLTTADQGR